MHVPAAPALAARAPSRGASVLSRRILRAEAVPAPALLFHLWEVALTVEP
jgi:hypothetical protein